MNNTRVLALDLHALSGDDVFERRIRLTADTPLIIGRASAQRGRDAAYDNAMIQNPVISREHATIRTESSCQKVYIKDLKSLHGTMVDGRTLEKGEEVDVQSGAVLELGSTVVRGTEMHSPAKYRVTYEVLDVPRSLPTANDAKVGYTADDLSEYSYDSDSSTSSNGPPVSEPTMQRDISDARQPLRELEMDHDYSDGEHSDKASEFGEATFSDLEEEHEGGPSHIPVSIYAIEGVPETPFGYTALTSSQEPWINYKSGLQASHPGYTGSTGPAAESKSSIPTPPSDIPALPTVQKFPPFRPWTVGTSNLPSINQTGVSRSPPLDSTLTNPTSVRPKTFSNSIPEIVDSPLTQDYAPAAKFNKRKADDAQLDEEHPIKKCEPTEAPLKSTMQETVEELDKEPEFGRHLEVVSEARETRKVNQAVPPGKRAKAGIGRQVAGHVASFLVGGAVVFGALATLPDSYFA